MKYLILFFFCGCATLKSFPPITFNQYIYEGNHKYQGTKKALMDKIGRQCKCDFNKESEMILGDNVFYVDRLISKDTVRIFYYKDDNSNWRDIMNIKE